MILVVVAFVNRACVFYIIVIIVDYYYYYNSPAICILMLMFKQNLIAYVEHTNTIVIKQIKIFETECHVAQIKKKKKPHSSAELSAQFV